MNRPSISPRFDYLQLTNALYFLSIITNEEDYDKCDGEDANCYSQQFLVLFVNDSDISKTVMIF